MPNRINKNQKKFKGIYILPNLITTSALAFGFWSVNFSIQSSFSVAAAFIVIAAILDGLDGRIARLTNSQSSFGAHYDSLSDVICFGIAPAVLVYTWNLHTLGKVGSFITFIFLAATALRLARFNSNLAVGDPNNFQGLPSPAGAISVASLVWYLNDLGISGVGLEIISIFVTLIVGSLMVSNIRYASFKKIGFKKYVVFIRAVAVLIAVAAIFVNPPLMIMLYIWGYVLCGLVVFLLGSKKDSVNQTINLSKKLKQKLAQKEETKNSEAKKPETPPNQKLDD